MWKKIKKLESDLDHKNQRPKYNNSPEQLNTKENIKNIYNSKERVVQMFNDYLRDKSRLIYESKHGTGLKILTPKNAPEIASSS